MLSREAAAPIPSLPRHGLLKLPAGYQITSSDTQSSSAFRSRFIQASHMRRANSVRSPGFIALQPGLTLSRQLVYFGRVLAEDSAPRRIVHSGDQPFQI